jgi:hypothetical protein
MNCGKLGFACSPRFCRNMGDKPDIEVTPEMVEAGVEEMRSYSDANRELLRMALRQVLDAMLAASPTPLSARYSSDSL